MARKIKVLAIGHSYVVGLNRSLLREVAANGDFEVVVAAPARFRSELGPIDCHPEPLDSPLKVISVKTHWDRWVYTFGYDDDVLARLMREERFDVVFAWEEPYIYAGYQIARAVGRYAPQTAFSFRTAQSLPKRYPPPFNYFERICLQQIDGWIAGAHLVYENSVARGYPANKGRVLTLAVDTRTFKPFSEEAKAAVRKELGLQAPMLGYLGRLTPEKGIDVMLRAIELLEPQRPWSLMVLGAGPSDATITQWARRNNWRDRVMVKLVPHSDVPRYLASMDLLLAPSLTTRRWREQFGRMVIEAFACGVPIISSDSGELPFLVGDTGWVVPEADPAAMATAIRTALDDNARREAVAREGLQRANDYSARTLGRAFSNYFRELAEQKTGASRAA